MENEVFLALLTFLTSGITGAIGVGGGMILIAIIPSFLPAIALIPVHGLTQLASNFSRAAFVYKDIQYRVIPKFLLGSIFGAIFIYEIISYISFETIPIFIGSYILLSLWSKKFNEKIKRFENYFLIGFMQTGLSMVVGATGPLSMTLLLKEYNDKEKVVATQAALMSITHIFKIITFIFLGFAFKEYLWTSLFMVFGATVGSYFGTKIRNKIDSKKFKVILKILLTLLAINAIVGVFFKI